MLGWDKKSGIFSTYVLVSELDNDLWFDMCVDPEELCRRQQRSPADTKVEKWIYDRTETGDKLMERRQLCQMCWMH